MHLVEDWLLVESPNPMWVRRNGDFGKLSEHDKSSQVWVVSQSLCLPFLHENSDWLLVVLSFRKRSEVEECEVAISNHRSCVEALDRELSDDSDRQELSDASSQSELGMVESRLISRSVEVLLFSAINPGSQGFKVFPCFLGHSGKVLFKNVL